VSVSNKSFIGRILKQENPSSRLAGSLAAEVVCVLNGANIIRTHNVAETKEAISIAQKIS
jgi:dihydropteroate synthase